MIHRKTRSVTFLSEDVASGAFSDKAGLIQGVTAAFCDKFGVIFI